MIEHIIGLAVNMSDV